MRELKEIEFNSGVRAENIQYNFEVLQEQISADRLSTYGSGISRGFELSINQFDFIINEGEIIVKDGSLIGIDKTIVNVSKPKLTTITENNLIVGTGGQIILKETPYDLERMHVSYIGESTNGISIVSTNGIKIQPRIITGNTIIVDDSYSNTTIVNVTYSFTNKRYDTIYIDKEKQIKTIEGTTSASPSIMIPDDEDSYYILCFLEIDPYAIDITTGLNKAKVSIKQDLRTFKNIYTDKDNVLYICGTPFKDLQIVHMTRPENPKENTLWYDSDSNLLKVWKTIDGIENWIDINNTTIFSAYEVKMWDIDHNPEDEQYFLFSPSEINMHFNPGRNELAVHIDQNVLHYDQYDEITLKDAIGNTKLTRLLTKLGYTKEFIEKYDSKYENIGIGFKLLQPLNASCYVEAIVTHRATNNPLSTRFQRSATFCQTGWYNIDSKTPTISLDNTFYRYGENQLELFLNGVRLICGKDYTEGTDLVDPKKGNVSKAFTILKTIPNNSVLSYKITMNVYSYDHIEALLNSINDNLTEQIDTARRSLAEISTLKTNLENSISRIENDTAYLKKTDSISYDSLQSSLKSLIPKKAIDRVYKVKENKIEMEGIASIDNLNVYCDGKLLISKKVSEDYWDYDISYNDEINSAVITFNSTFIIKQDALFHIIGFKFSEEEDK